MKKLLVILSLIFILLVSGCSSASSIPLEYKNMSYQGTYYITSKEIYVATFINLENQKLGFLIPENKNFEFTFNKKYDIVLTEDSFFEYEGFIKSTKESE